MGIKYVYEPLGWATNRRGTPIKDKHGQPLVRTRQKIVEPKYFKRPKGNR